MARYRMYDDGGAGDFEADDMAEAEEHAEEWLRDGDWDTAAGPAHVHARVVEIDAAGRTVGLPRRIDVHLDQDEPECDDDHEHSWSSDHDLVGGIEENPGVWGHGGGVVIHEVCLRCGVDRITDTWAQDPATGEQGLREVRYSEDREEGGNLRGARIRAGLEEVEDE